MALGLPSVVPKDGAEMMKPVTSPPGRCSQGVPVISKRLPPISRGRVSLPVMSATTAAYRRR